MICIRSRQISCFRDIFLKTKLTDFIRLSKVKPAKRLLRLRNYLNRKKSLYNHHKILGVVLAKEYKERKKKDNFIDKAICLEYI